MTAPKPLRPAARISLMIHATLLKFSPAGPIQTILTFWSFSSFLMICWVSVVFMPHTLLALRNWTLSFLIQT